MNPFTTVLPVEPTHRVVPSPLTKRVLSFVSLPGGPTRTTEEESLRFEKKLVQTMSQVNKQTILPNSDVSTVLSFCPIPSLKGAHPTP